MAVCGVFVERRQILEQRNLPVEAAADRIHQVAPDLAAGIRQSLRKLRGLGVEQDTDRLARARRQHHHPCSGVALFSAGPVDEIHSVRPAVAPERHLIDHCVGGDVKVPAHECGRQMHSGRLVVCPDGAAASARCRPQTGRAFAHVIGEDLLCCRIARMQAWRRTFVVQRLSKHRAVTRYHRDPQALRPLRNQ